VLLCSDPKTVNTGYKEIQTRSEFVPAGTLPAVVGFDPLISFPPFFPLRLEGRQISDLHVNPNQNKTYHNNKTNQYYEKASTSSAAWPSKIGGASTFLGETMANSYFSARTIC